MSGKRRVLVDVPKLPHIARVLLDSMSGGISLTLEDGIIVHTNSVIDEMLGYGSGELIGQHISIQNAYSPAENARMMAEVIAELQRSGAWKGEWQARKKDGAQFLATSRISVVNLEGRKYWLCVQEDVTEDRVLSAALAESRARLELAIDAGEIGIWDWDLLSGEMQYSPRAKAICGFEPDMVVTISDARRVTHPEDLPRTSEMARRALDPAIRARIPYEYRILRPDGEVRWVVANGEAIFSDDNGTVRASRYMGTLQDITERRRLEEADRSARARLAMAVDAGRMAVWEINLKTDQIVGSPELNRLLGFPEDATPSAAEIRSRYYPGERERLGVLVQAILSRGDRILEAEYRYVWPDNSIRWIWIRAELTADADLKPAHAIGALIDITSRKLAEESLRTSEARLKLAQQALGFGAWDWEIESGVVNWSPEVYEILGIDPHIGADLLFQAWLDALHPDDRASAENTVRQAAREGTPFRMDFRIFHPARGEFRWVRSHGLALPDENGRPVRVLGAVLDATDEHRREEQLRALAGSLQSAVDASQMERDRIYELSNDLFAVAGFDGFLKSINPAWERLLGYSQADLLGRPFAELTHPEDREAAEAVLASLLQGSAVQRFEDRLCKADGEYIWISWAAVPEGDRFYAVGRDVTREKEREESLRQAQKMEAVGQLTGGLAHDFNNLLGAVMGGLELIRRKPDDPARVRRWAEQGLEAAERGAKLTAQLLAFSRSQKLELRPVSVADLLTNMQDLLLRTLGPLYRLHLQAVDRSLGVLSDPIQLELAFLNLAINARDAMPDGGEIFLSARRQDCAGEVQSSEPGYVELSVRDTGPGMAPHVLARAFDPFFTTKGVGKGTGLGLSQVYGMARQAGGTVHIESALGAGTTVRITLPQAEIEDSRERLPETGERPNLQPGSILVIDDDPDMRRALSDQLEELGYRVRAEQSGVAGLAALDEEAPILVIVDFAMPEMNGAEIASAIRSRNPDLPIVFATGYSDTEAIENAVGPTVPILRKPFRLHSLQEVLSGMLSS